MGGFVGSVVGAGRARPYPGEPGFLQCPPGSRVVGQHRHDRRRAPRVALPQTGREAPYHLRTQPPPRRVRLPDQIVDADLVGRRPHHPPVIQIFGIVPDAVTLDDPNRPLPFADQVTINLSAPKHSLPLYATNDQVLRWAMNLIEQHPHDD